MHTNPHALAAYHKARALGLEEMAPQIVALALADVAAKTKEQLVARINAAPRIINFR